MRVKIQFVDNLIDDTKCEITASGQHYRKDLPPGSAEWLNGTDQQIAALEFTCPCGCGKLVALTVRPGFGGAMWQWDGNKTLPTLQPSILLTSTCRWHGFLTRGVFGYTREPEREAE